MRQMKPQRISLEVRHKRAQVIGRVAAKRLVKIKQTDRVTVEQNLIGIEIAMQRPVVKQTTVEETTIETQPEPKPEF